LKSGFESLGPDPQHDVANGKLVGPEDAGVGGAGKRVGQFAEVLGRGRDEGGVNAIGLGLLVSRKRVGSGGASH
jgi:hypothetical protein